MCYEHVKLTNISTKTESETEYQKFINDVRKHNISNTLWLLFTIAATMLCEFLAHTFLQADIRLIVMIVLGVVGGIIIKVLLDEYKSDCRIFQPSTYLYHKILESNQLLTAKVQSLDDEYVLVLDVANNDGDVTHKYIYGFKKTEKVGIEAVTVDLSARKVYVPYAKEHTYGKS